MPLRWPEWNVFLTSCPSVKGPFTLAENRPVVELLLKRNPKYWNPPLIDQIRIPIQQNREIELNRFRRGELDLINNLDPESFDRLAKEIPAAVHDNGPSTNVDFLWFNLKPASSLPQYKKDWFQSTAFRQAVSAAINREDLCRVVFRGHARAAVGPFSPPINSGSIPSCRRTASNLPRL